jgi:thiamine-monophosphate kinase
MSLKEIGEFGFIERIRPGCLIRPEGVLRGIGEDAAAFRPPPGLLSLITTDMLVENVHFLREAVSGRDLGYKSLAVNLSDIAAMGGTAREAFIAIAVPDDCPLPYLEEVFQGMKELAGEHAVNILGGDTTRSAAGLVISVTVCGAVAEAEMLRRDAARPGDVVFSTGCLGDSRAGLNLILERTPVDSPALAALLDAHRRPRPHLAEGRFLACRPGVHAAIDVSDGLSSDIAHIAAESRVGVRLEAGRIPLSEQLKEYCLRFGCSPLEVAVSGGEDYTLLITAAAGAADGIARDFEAAFGRPLHAIGAITAGAGVVLAGPDGRTAPLNPSGWDHFKGGRHGS